MPSTPSGTCHAARPAGQLVGARGARTPSAGEAMAASSASSGSRPTGGRSSTTRAVDVVANLLGESAHRRPTEAALGARQARPLREAARATTASRPRRCWPPPLPARRAAPSCGFNYRYMPAMRLAREIVESGRLGDALHFRAVYLQDHAAGDVPRPAAQRLARGDRLLPPRRLPALPRVRGGGGPGDHRQADHVRRRRRGRLRRRGRPAGGGSSPRSRRRASRGAGRAARSSSSTAPTGSLWWDMEDLNRLHVFYQRRRGGWHRWLPRHPRQPARPSVHGPVVAAGPHRRLGAQLRRTNGATSCGAIIDERPISPEQATSRTATRRRCCATRSLPRRTKGRRVRIDELRET